MNELTGDEKRFISAKVTELKRILKFQEEEQIPTLKKEISILEKMVR